MRKVTTLFSIATFLGIHFAKAQNLDYLANINYNHFLVNPGASMPSFYGDDYADLNIQNQSYTGLLSDIQGLYADFTYEQKN